MYPIIQVRHIPPKTTTTLSTENVAQLIPPAEAKNLSIHMNGLLCNFSVVLSYNLILTLAKRKEHEMFQWQMSKSTFYTIVYWETETGKI